MPQPRIEGRGAVELRACALSIPQSLRCICRRSDRPGGNKFGRARVLTLIWDSGLDLPSRAYGLQLEFCDWRRWIVSWVEIFFSRARV
jgi:hypothetical protein